VRRSRFCASLLERRQCELAELARRRLWLNDDGLAQGRVSADQYNLDDNPPLAPTAHTASGVLLKSSHARC